MPIDNDRNATGLHLPIPSGLIFLIWLLVVMARSGRDLVVPSGKVAWASWAKSLLELAMISKKPPI